MKTYLSVLFAGIFGSLLLTGGCVSQKDYDALQAQNRNAQKELARVMAALNERDAQYAALEKQLADLQIQLKAKDDQIALLSGGKDALLAKIKELQAIIDKMKGDWPKPPDVTALPPGLDDALAKLAKMYVDLFDYDAKRGMLKFKSDMTFDPGEDTVKDRAKEALTKLAEILNTAEAANFHAYVAGHTDDIPISRPETKKRHPTNWYLSVHRAVAVEGVLEKGGVTAARLGAMGFGEYHPVAPNAAGHKGNVLNRRVEIWIIPPSRFMTVEQGGAPAKSE